MKRITLLLLALPLAGCSLGAGNLQTLPVYAGFARTVVEAELTVDLTTLTDQELADRRQIMAAVNPVVTEVKTLSQAYTDAIDDEIARRAGVTLIAGEDEPTT